MHDPSTFRETPLLARLQTDPAGVLDAPARPNPGIVIHVGPSVHIACNRGGRRHQGLSVHGDVDIIPGGTPCRWELRGEDTALILGVPAGLVRSVSKESGIDPDRVEILNRFQIRDPHIEHIGWAVKAELESGYLNGSLYLDGLATAFATHLVNRHSSQSRAPMQVRGGLAGYRLKQVLAYVDDHIGDSLPLTELAAVAGLGVSRFSAAFRASVGQSVHRYVTRRRVERARDLLPQPDQSISQIAMATGFAHASHLAHHMRRLLGVSPRYFTGRRG